MTLNVCQKESVTHEKESVSAIKKENDWTKMNLRGRVKLLREISTSACPYKSTENYFLFNEDGFLIEKGYSCTIEGRTVKTVEEERLYYNTGELKEIDEGSVKSVFDKQGNIIRQHSYSSIYKKGCYGLEKIDIFRYVTTGKRTVDIFRNNIKIRSVEYDKYRNVIVEKEYENGKQKSLINITLSYNKDGSIITKTERRLDLISPDLCQIKSYKYDSQGNIIEKIEYEEGDKSLNPKLSERYIIKYDKYGNPLDDGISYMYDLHGNWILRENLISSMNTKRIYKYFKSL